MTTGTVYVLLEVVLGQLEGIDAGGSGICLITQLFPPIIRASIRISHLSRTCHLKGRYIAGILAELYPD